MDALRILSELSAKALKAKHTTVPEYALPVPKFKDKTANDLTKAIFAWLSLNGNYVTRIQTQGQYNTKLKKFTKSTTRLGTADLHGVINGRHLSVEVKAGKDKLSEHQIKTKQDIEKAGGLYFVAKDFQSFYDWYNEQIKKD